MKADWIPEAWQQTMVQGQPVPTVCDADADADAAWAMALHCAVDVPRDVLTQIEGALYALWQQETWQETKEVTP